MTVDDVPRIFKDIDPKVQIIDLQMNDMGPEGAALIAEKLKTNSTITELDLSGKRSKSHSSKDNEIGNEGATALADMLKTNSTLQILDLDSKFNNNNSSKSK